MAKPAKSMDLLALIFSVVVIGGAALWTLQNGIFAAAALKTNSRACWVTQVLSELAVQPAR